MEGQVKARQEGLKKELLENGKRISYTATVSSQRGLIFVLNPFRPTGNFYSRGFLPLHLLF